MDSPEVHAGRPGHKSRDRTPHAVPRGATAIRQKEGCARRDSVPRKRHARHLALSELCIPAPVCVGLCQCPSRMGATVAVRDCCGLPPVRTPQNSWQFTCYRKSLPLRRVLCRVRIQKNIDKRQKAGGHERERPCRAWDRCFGEGSKSGKPAKTGDPSTRYARSG
jgi:hypothetical protein